MSNLDPSDKIVVIAHVGPVSISCENYCCLGFGFALPFYFSTTSIILNDFSYVFFYFDQYSGNQQLLSALHFTGGILLSTAKQ